MTNIQQIETQLRLEKAMLQIELDLKVLKTLNQSKADDNTLFNKIEKRSDMIMTALKVR